MPTDNIRILLVDDESELVEYLSKRLLKAGFTVRAASSGEEAVAVAADEEFDVAIVDLKMPGIDGVETQRLLKEAGPFLQTVVLTGFGSLDTALESGKQDAFLYLEKPVDHEELVAAIRAAAERKAELQRERLREEMESVLDRLSVSGGSHRTILEELEALRKTFGVD